MKYIVCWFFFKWGTQVSLLFSILLKYFISVQTGMGILFMINWEHFWGECFNVNVTCTDLLFFSPWVNLICFILKCFRNLVGIYIEGEDSGVIRAYAVREVLIDWGISAVKTLYILGDKSFPRRTPAYIGWVNDRLLPWRTTKDLFCRYNFKII